MLPPLDSTAAELAMEFIEKAKALGAKARSAADRIHSEELNLEWTMFTQRARDILGEDVFSEVHDGLTRAFFRAYKGDE